MRKQHRIPHRQNRVGVPATLTRHDFALRGADDTYKLIRHVERLSINLHASDAVWSAPVAKSIAFAGLSRDLHMRRYLVPGRRASEMRTSVVIGFPLRELPPGPVRATLNAVAEVVKWQTRRS